MTGRHGDRGPIHAVAGRELLFDLPPRHEFCYDQPFCNGEKWAFDLFALLVSYSFIS